MLFPQVEPVIGEEDDNGVVLVRAFFEGSEDTPDLSVDIGGRGQVGLSSLFMFSRIDDLVGEAPDPIAHRLGQGREVIQVILLQLGRRPSAKVTGAAV